jgi:hypothetical protein
MISTLFTKLKAAFRPADEDNQPAPGADRYEVALVNEARTDDDRRRVAG